MSNFTLIKTLLNPPVAIVTETAVINTNRGFDVSIDQVELLKTLDTDGNTVTSEAEVGITYAEDGREEMHLTLNATLEGTYSTDDNSFDYSYGSINGTHGGPYSMLGEYKLTNIRIPRVEDNIELFKLDSDKMKVVYQRINEAMTEMSSDEIENHVNTERLKQQVERIHQNNNSPD